MAILEHQRPHPSRTLLVSRGKLSGLDPDRRGLLTLVMFFLTQILCGQTGVLSTPQPDGATEPARILAVSDEAALDRFVPNEGVVELMFESLLQGFTNTAHPKEAWEQFLQPEDVVGIKVLCEPGRLSGTRPAVVKAVIRSLGKAGVAPSRVVVWDRRLGPMLASGYGSLREELGVRLAGAQEEGYDSEVFYEAPLVGQLVFGDLEFGKANEAGVGRRSFVTKILTQQVSRILVIHPLINHYRGGVHGNLVGLSRGAFDNFLRFEVDQDRFNQAVVEAIALPEVFDKFAFSLSDALICQYQGEERGFLQYSKAFQSLRMSRDMVAMDVRALSELQDLRRQASLPVETSVQTLYENAQLLELGIADASRIRMDFLHRLPSGAESSPVSKGSEKVRP